MKRRILLKSLAAGTLLTPLGLWLTRSPVSLPETSDPLSISLHDPEPQIPDGRQAAQWNRISQFDNTFSSDVFLTSPQYTILDSILRRMVRLQKYVGHGNFNILGYDTMLRYAQQFSQIGAFSKDELDFIDEIFYHDAHVYGFMGRKVMQQLTDRITVTDTIKVAGTGHYLFRGESVQMFSRLKKDIGPTLVLTSGIRGIVKQLYLFLAKTRSTGGNLSRASRSLAPPGHSYHGVGDFDVGQVNLGADNFTARFSESKAYKRLRQLTYIDIRYTSNNNLGVRFEPWHIKVVT